MYLRDLPKPPQIFDRAQEWNDLAAFVTDEEPGPRLGVLSGRRRQGKSFLLKALTEATGGFYFAAVEATRTESLQLLGEAIGRFTDAPVPPRPHDWTEALQLLFDLAAQRSVPVVIDEFPHLVTGDSSLPSRLRATLGARAGRHPRLLLCGSAMSCLGTSPQYTRPALNLVIRPLGYRKAAEFWAIDDPRLAVLTHAVVGGTPAYRREFVTNDVPERLEDFDDWVCRTALNPARRLHHEPQFLIASEPDIRDRALYHSVLGAVAAGNHTSGGIASAVGRKATDISQPLTVLKRCGLLTAEQDAFRGNRSAYRIAEPLITFHHAVVRRNQAQLTRQGNTAAAWAQAQDTFLSKVVGPHFEHLCRGWVAEHADPDTFGGLPIEVTSGTVADPAARTSHEVDVVVRGAVGQDHGILLSIGEAKWNKEMDIRHLDRLRHILTLLTSRGFDTTHTRPACYSGIGFTPDLQAAAARGEVVLVDLRRLYGGA
ncbi:ATP-binding protein [Streptomyces sp. NBC_00287]|uniref:AAA family ATPase n=1 Tax=Streptomyces sp. NBC_00287 TaxID=2975702 RepID=UPI002E2E434C|nr:ATP-binding protein [Streptomyces sp. NBC_00287]